MARTPRIFFPDAIYHVYCRTARGEMVFSDSSEAVKFVETVAEVKRLHGFLVFAWALMGNHYHLVIQTRETPLWRTMARIQCRVAGGYNRRRQLLGRMWQSRYKARLVRDEIYYQHLLAYVHLNPVAARLADDPACYEWSGHSALIGKRPARIVDTQGALRGFGETLIDAREAYLKHMRVVAEARWLRYKVRDLPWWEQVANDEKFVEESDGVDGFDHQGNPVLHEASERLDLAAVCALVCDALGTTTEDLQGRSRAVEVATARRAFAVLAVERLGRSVGEVAAQVCKHPGSVSRWLETSRRLSNGSHGVSALVDLIHDRISGLP